MVRKSLSTSLTVLFLTLASLAQNSSDNFPPEQLLREIRPEGIRAQMGFLADDLLEGRGTGTRGYQLAATYVRSQFEEMGLKPAGDNGTYFQNIRFRKIELQRNLSSMKVKVDGSKKTLTMDVDFLMRGDPNSQDSTADAPLVFAGYGVTAPDFNYDDYANVDVKGKIVLIFYGAPPRFPSAPGAHYSNGDVKLANAAAHGAIGVISIWGGKQEQRISFASLVRFFQPPSLRWLDSRGMPNDAQPSIKATAWVSTQVASAFFANSGHSWDGVQQAALDSKSQSFPLKASATIHAVSKHSDLTSPNIAGILPGSDPELSKEYVVFSAHADHIGIDRPVNGDAIYNGAFDNASGTAALLEIARAFSSLEKSPRRSILFLVVTGEEAGLLGSEYYAEYPTVPMSRIIANVNIDGISLLYDFKDVVALGSEHSTIGPIVDRVAQHMGVEVSPDPLPEEVFFIRSDQYSFVKKGVPSVFLSDGFKAVDPKIDGKKMSDAWEATRYHMPTDDMNQPINFDAGAKCTRINLAVGYELAQADARPRWNAGDFFQRFVDHPASAVAAQGPK